MNILILNVGSSSVKYEVFENDISIIKGLIERITGKKGFSKAILKITSILREKRISIDAIGHRVVHGGAIGKTSRITPSLIKIIEQVTDLAPLHNTPELHTIRECMKIFSIPQFAVFDTAFHSSMPDKAFTYALPHGLSAKFRIKRYGFHGTSHEYVVQEACKKLRKDIKKQRIISCHLGNGCSITAIKNGRSIDTSMGFTPLEGLVMGTRCGDIDPGIITYLMRKGFSTEKLDSILNHQSGLLGISGVSNDFRDVLKSKDPRAKLAIDVFVYRLIKYIGAYHAVLGGTDILIFTGGIGENSPKITKLIFNQVRHLKIKNKIVIKTDEAKMMARKIMNLL
ncbi:MAG: acetate/propionate family kinase [Nanoarchaeota archaeon]|nr:acetate/propionate family kinase [Nanoarchaeota archaeon]